MSDVDASASGFHRLDGRDEAISLSIASINARMFDAKRRRSGNPHWVVLLLDPCILWTHRCRFCRRNAARREMLNHRGRLDGPWGFSMMFSDPQHDCPPLFAGSSYREDTCIPDYLPTHPDAEVQVFQPVGQDLIGGAWLDRSDFAESVQAELDKLPGPERTTWIRPFSEFTNGYRKWLLLEF